MKPVNILAKALELRTKNGEMTAKERAAATAYADTGSQVYAAFKADLSQGGTSKALARPDVRALVVELQTARLFDELLPAAVNCLSEVLHNAKAPAGARVQAAKLVFDRTLGVQGTAEGKEPHEMSGAELADAIARLEDIAAGKARVIDPPVTDIFD